MKRGWFCWLQTAGLKQHLFGHLTLERERFWKWFLFILISSVKWRAITLAWWKKTAGWGAKCFSACQDWGVVAGSGCLMLTVVTIQSRGARSSYQAHSPSSRVCLCFERVTLTDHLSPASLEHSNTCNKQEECLCLQESRETLSHFLTIPGQF